MTVVEQALKKAGVKTPPQGQRVWMYLHDHPHVLGRTSMEISKALGIKNNSVSSVISDMCDRGMVTSHSVPRKTGSTVKHYKAVGDTYERLPRLKRPPETAKWSPATPATLTPVTRIPSIEDMTIREAREMYQELKRFFRE